MRWLVLVSNAALSYNACWQMGGMCPNVSRREVRADSTDTTSNEGLSNTMNWSDLIGRRLGPHRQYTILEEIGRGGSSRVYRASDAALGRDVAIKVIPNDAEDRVGFVRRFEREVQAVAQLNHPNIVSVFDRGETDDVVFLVMECVLGGTLKQQMGRPLPTAEATTAIVQMARALHHAHQRGIVHRDVKPSNMLVDSANAHHLLLTDFGIAKLQGARGLTKSGTTIGTPEYMAPEQAEGTEIDPRADVYALGCVLYETLSGRPPFVGSTPVSVLYQQVHSRPAYIRGFNPDVPRDLARVVEQALAKHPEERFGTAEMLADALIPYTNGLVESPSRLLDAPAPPRPAPPALPAVPRTPTPPGFDPRANGPAAPPERRASGDLWILGQMPYPATPPLDRPATTGGLGQEGLDALFSHDETVPPWRAGSGALGPQTGELPPPPAQRAPTSSGRLTGAPIPLPDFRLPGRTRPLNQPLTGDERLDVDRLVRQEQGPGQEAAQRYQAGMAGDLGGWPQVPDGQEEFTYSDQYVPGGQAAPQAPQARRMERGPRSGMLNDENGEPVTALRRALLASGKPPAEPRTVWRPDASELTDTARTRRTNKPAPIYKRPVKKKRRPVWAGAVAAAALLVFVTGWVAFTGSGLGFTQGAKSTPVATSTLAPTPVPTDTPQPAPTATATASPQQIANQQAANSFRAVILSDFGDLSCGAGNARTSFSRGQSVYVDLCTSGSLVAAPVTITIRRGGAVVYTMLSGQFMSPGHGYFYYTYGLSPGTYDLRVTMAINGVTAVARNLTFTVS